MQSSQFSAHITPSEWRWVVVFAVALTALAFVPFLWVALSGVSGTEWQFMGVLNNYRDGATYLSKMTQGVEGEWLVHFLHTSEPHNGVFIQVIYPALGQLARFIRIPPIALFPPIAIFHAARVIASLIMYLAIYQFAATVWMRLRTRRVFFWLIAVGSGLGWLFSPLTGDTSFPDLAIPEIFPFYSSLVNVHFPLSIACLALLSSIMIVAFRPGSVEDPKPNNGGLAAALLSFALSLLFPQALLPFGVALALYVAIYWMRKRRLSMREFRWLLVVSLPALPIAVYYVAIVGNNPVVAEWNRQNVTLAPNPLVFLIGLGIPLIMALPGIYRALRRFEEDGDRLMLLWLLAMVVLIYFPSNVQRRFAAGMMLPIIYFATRSLEDFWFRYINRRWRYRLLFVVFPLITLTYLLIFAGNLRLSPGPFLERNYAIAFQWLRSNTRPDDVVLASEKVSVWVPGWVGVRVVYGHPYETLNATVKERQVHAWYAGEAEGGCGQLLTDYNVRYVITGPQESELGQTDCLQGLEPVFSAGDVSVYAP